MDVFHVLKIKQKLLNHAKDHIYACFEQIFYGWFPGTLKTTKKYKKTRGLLKVHSEV